MSPGRLGSDALAGELLMRHDLAEGAAQLLGRALELSDGEAEVHARLAQALYFLDDLEGAIEHYKSARRLAMDDALVDSNLAIVLTFQGQLDAAMDAHRRALATAPEAPDGAITPLRVVLLWNAAHTLLASGRLIDGWDAYEARVPIGFGPRTRVGLPEWRGGAADTSSVLVLGEQGIGDQVLFASCLPDLISEAERVHIECDPRLAPLFARSFPAAHVRSPGRSSGSGVNEPRRGGADAYVALGSLPRRYRRSLDDFSNDGAYLRADPVRVNTWRARLDQLPPGPRVGITWRSVSAFGARRREYAPLLLWAPILEQQRLQFINLQYGDCEQELLDVERELGITIHRWDDFDLFDDLDGVAALIEALDAVVAPRNSVAHIAGAVGTKTAMLANPFVWSDLGTSSLPWFPAVTTFYRRPGGAWTEPITAAAEVLGQLADSSSRNDA
jgi:hypothetical protein